MDIYFRTENSIIKMNDILEVNGKYLTIASLDRTKQCVLCQYKSQERAKEVLEQIDYVIDTKVKEDTRVLIIAIPKE